MSGDNLDKTGESSSAQVDDTAQSESSTASERTHGGGSTGDFSTSRPQSGFDVVGAISRAFTVCSRPKTIWPELKADGKNIPDTLRDYLLILIVISALAGYLGMVLIGFSVPGLGTFRWPFFGGLVSTILSIALQIAAVYMAAHVATFLAPKFGRQLTLENAFKAVAYAMTPALLAGILTILPVLSPLVLPAGIYGLYMYFQGLNAMCDERSDNHGTFFAANLACNFVLGIVLALVWQAVTPEPPLPTFEGKFKELQLGDKVTIDTSEIQKGLDHFQRALQKAQ